MEVEVKATKFAFNGMLYGGLMLGLLILAGLGIGTITQLGEAASLSYECCYENNGEKITSPQANFYLRVALLGDCGFGCSRCKPYLDVVGQFRLSVYPPKVKLRCTWIRFPQYSNFYTGSCYVSYDAPTSVTQRYDVTVIVPSTNRAIKATPYFYVQADDLNPSFCGPLSWSPYPARSLIAGKTARFTVELKDSYGNRKNTANGPLTEEEKSSFFSVVTLSFLREIRDLSKGYTESEGVAWFSFTPVTCGTWSASVGVKGWTTGPGYTDVSFSGSPFDLTINAGDISITDSRGFWWNNVNLFKAGDAGTLSVLLMDAYKNNITIATGRRDFFQFNVFTTNSAGNNAPCDVNMYQDQQVGFENVMISNNIVGSYNLHVGAYDSRRIIGSPFSYNVVSGDVSIEQCTGFWTSSRYQAGQKTTLLVVLKDRYGNDATTLFGRDNFRQFGVFTYNSSTGERAYEGVIVTLDSKTQRESITFNANNAGLLSYYVSYGNSQIKGSPFSLIRLPGSLLSSKLTWTNFLKNKKNQL